MTRLGAVLISQDLLITEQKQLFFVVVKNYTFIIRVCTCKDACGMVHT